MDRRKEGHHVSRQGKWEYPQAIHARYRQATRAEQGRSLDGLCHVTRYHRKAALRLLNGPPPGRRPSRRPRPPGVRPAADALRPRLPRGRSSEGCPAPGAPGDRRNPFALAPAIAERLTPLYALAHHRAKPEPQPTPPPRTAVERRAGQALSERFGIPVDVGAEGGLSKRRVPSQMARRSGSR